jgi:nucleotide-binding universal stress UspA family protein
MNVNIGRHERPAGPARMTRRSEAPQPLRVRSVLLPLDGSAFAEQAVPWAAAIARKSRARLRLALVHQSPPSPPLDKSSARLYTRIELALKKSEREYLRAVATRIKGAGALQLATAALTGPPARALADYVREVGVDLVVMTTHGLGGLQRVWLGSVADRLLRLLEVPVLLIRPRPSEPAIAEPRLEEVLVPLDGSRQAEAALPSALALATLFGARLSLMQAVEPVTAAAGIPVTFAQPLDEEVTTLRRREAQDYLDGVAERLRAGGVQTQGGAVLSGSPLAGIQAAAKNPAVGMIALATHGRGGLGRLVLGSVTDKLVRMGELPVLVTRPRGR